MEKRPFFERLYTGEGGIDFVGHRRRWYMITAALLIIAIGSIGIRGFTLGIDFVGGTKITMPAASVTTSEVSTTFHDATGVEPQRVQIVGSGNARNVEIQTKHLSENQISQAREALFNSYHPKDGSGKVTPDAIGDSTVSNSWGSTITNRMLLALAVFLALIFVYITVRFERDMAISAICALAVDAIVISGTYSLIGFEVSPATVIGFLTVLAYSLYDTVVVFDKVHENTADIHRTTRATYGEQANLAVNQTVMRSISTSLFSILPIGALLVVAVWLLGVGTLKDLALVQLIGVIEGTFSSIFLATPILVSLKNRQRKYREHNARVRNSSSSRGGNAEEGTDAAGRASESDREEALGSHAVSVPVGTTGETAEPTPSTESGAGRRRRVTTPKVEKESRHIEPRSGGGSSWRPDRH